MFEVCLCDPWVHFFHVLPVVWSVVCRVVALLALNFLFFGLFYLRAEPFFAWGLLFLRARSLFIWGLLFLRAGPLALSKDLWATMRTLRAVFWVCPFLYMGRSPSRALRGQSSHTLGLVYRQTVHSLSLGCWKYLLACANWYFLGENFLEVPISLKVFQPHQGFYWRRFAYQMHLLAHNMPLWDRAWLKLLGI